MNFETWLKSRHAEIPTASVRAVLSLAEEGATIPFIARYRKEQTGNLDDIGIQAVLDSKEKWDTLTQRQAFIVEEIEKQKKLTPELKEKILSTFESNLLEDIYLPYKVKRRTKAQAAREAGLEPLADWIWGIGHGTETPLPGQTLELWAFTFRNEQKEVKDAQAAIDGAADILVERLSEMQDLRQEVRTAYFDQGHVKTGKGTKPKANSKFENYFEHSESVQALLKPENSHRYLAMKRGWMEEELSLGIGGPESDPEFEKRLLGSFEGAACSQLDSEVAPVLLKCARMAMKAHVIPSIENEVHKALREIADEAAIRVFSENVRKLLLSAPFGAKAVLGVDPGLRTGCKLAVVDDSGKYLASTVIHLQTETQKTTAKGILTEVLKNGKIRAIAVGNGTAGRETEYYIRGVMKEAGADVPVVMVSEAGASVYSASEAAREEFPDLDVTVRGAISIARRLQDPLAELVKIDPKSIGVGQYQHDVSQPALKRSLDFVVDSCVNGVGVSLNTASYHLLAHVAGIGPGLAKSIVEFREKKGLFKNRQELLEVSRFSKKSFEQAAGFLKIENGDNPLDNTGVHPERYPVLEGLAQKVGKSVSDLLGSGVALVKQAKELRDEVGAFTYDDIIKELEKPGRDPRDQFTPFTFRDDLHEVKDLKPGMVCPGIVTNVTNFGAFVDIGVHQDGLVHISQISTKFVKDPNEVVSPGDHVQVRVLEVNIEKKQISLTMKPEPGSQASVAGAHGSRAGARKDRAPRAPKPPRELKPSGEASPIKPYVKGEDRPQPSQRPNFSQPGSSDSRPRVQPTMNNGSAGPGSKGPKLPREKQIFNNAFAGLASLRKDLKPTGK